MSGISLFNLAKISAPIAPVQTALVAATSSTQVDALAAFTDGQEHLVIMSCDAAVRINFGATGLTAATALLGVPLGANEKIGVYMSKGINSFYRAFSTPGGQLTVWVAA